MRDLRATGARFYSLRSRNQDSDATELVKAFPPRFIFRSFSCPPLLMRRPGHLTAVQNYEIRPKGAVEPKRLSATAYFHREINKKKLCTRP
ncbi:hypothetical protein AVEN_54498-1 [Araneus ventricosus]|uniref:Uncharacterized protein n=1 Tax=Araneus ventricosus TaxID=182803 RepID=A0A4Y2EL31_ARAVE|nr:hypothetical protein AVEN_54498-1 [Araneus ventricosus]